MIVLRNCKFISDLTEGTALKQGDIVIQGDRISDILPCGSDVAEVTEEINMEGATVLPGLINAHVHLFMTREPDYWMEFSSVPDRTLECLKFSQFLLKSGYTTVRDCGDDRECPTVSLRNQISKGELSGPNIITSGPTVMPHEIGTEGLNWICVFGDTPMEVRRLARLNYKKGVDFLKLYGTGSMLAVDSVPGARIMEEDEMREGVRIAKLKQSYAAIHAHGAEAIEMAIRCGVRTIEHATFITDEALSLMDGRTDVGIVPTVSLIGEYLKMDPLPDEYQEMIEGLKDSLKNAYKHNVLIGWGTDISMERQRKEPGMEFRLRKEVLGYSNLDMLKQATIHSAKLLMKDKEIGSIKIGKMADLVVINGDPLEDISLMYGSPAHVIKSGVVIK